MLISSNNFRDPQGNIEELLSEDGNQDAVWRKLRIYLEEGVVEGSRIVIEARVGDNSGLGDIAIDDVVFHQGCSFIPGAVINSTLFCLLFVSSYSSLEYVMSIWAVKPCVLCHCLKNLLAGFFSKFLYCCDVM